MKQKTKILVYEDRHHLELKNLENIEKVYFGSWCFKNFNFGKNAPPDLWNDSSKLKCEIDYVQNFTLRLLEDVYSLLDYPKSYSSFVKLYYSWTAQMIFKLRSNWLLFENIDPIEVSSYTLDIDYVDVLAQDLEGSNMIYYYRDWNNFIFSSILKFKGISCINIKIPENVEPSLNNSSNYIKSFAIKLFLFYKLIKERIKIKRIKKQWILYFFTKQYNILPSYQKNDQLSSFINLKYIKYRKNLGGINVDHEFRKSLCFKRKFDDDFERYVTSMYFKLLPISLLEGIKLLDRYSLRNHFTNPPKKLVISDFLNNEIVLEYTSNFENEDVFVYQHGGGFGFNDFNFIEAVEKFYGKNYLTWGWKKDALDIPFISPEFEKYIKIKRVSKRNGIALILYDSPPYVPIFQPTIYSSGYTLYLRSMERLLSIINIDTEFVIRKYPRNDSGVDLDIYFPNSIINDNSPIEEFYNKYKLYIYTYNSTGFLELWKLGIPCILYIEESNWFVSGFSMELFNNLKESNLLFSDYYELNQFLLNNKDYISEWWYSPLIQSTLNDFLMYFASSKINTNNLPLIQSIFKI